LNRFITDSPAELAFVKEFCEARGAEFALSDVWEKGGDGGVELANKVLETLETKESFFEPIYKDELSLKEKIETIAKEIYGAGSVTYDPSAEKAIAKIEAMGFGNVPVCMAKNQYSLSDDQTKLGRPEGFNVNIREAYISAGAGFMVAITGTIMTMPGLPKVPAAERIDVDENGMITGLF
jgi:formate--tetrahydrofolate ligase